MGEPASWLARFAAHASATPDKEVFRFVDDHGKTVRAMTYSEFDRATARVAAALVGEGGWGLRAGDRVLLVYPPGLDFIEAFVGCLKAGIVAVPVYPPRPGQSKDLSMFVAVQSSCEAQVALTNGLYDFAKRVSGWKAFFTGGAVRWPALRWLVTDAGKLPNSSGSSKAVTPALPPVPADALAFLQYTSGSTSLPKGVMISHGNLAHNLSCIVDALEAVDDTVVVSWLPQYHDMGLIGSQLGAAYCGGRGVFMSPVSFVKRPALWLELASRFGATHMQAPNFAFKLATRKFDAASAPAGFSLASVRHMFNAAEPIEADAMDGFLDAFAPFGLKRSAMAPGYGLAEHTVYVCDRGSQRLWLDKLALEKDRRVEEVAAVPNDGVSARAVHVVGCGDPHRKGAASGISVRIVDPDSREEVADDRVGEIWIRSASKAQGYFGNDALTAEAFHARIEPSGAGELLEQGDGWLRSGDLGFMHKSELFVCGRLKDLIIVRGRNHYPQDIEHTVERADPQIRPGCVAAFALPSPHGEGELLGVVAEVRDPSSPGLDALSRKLRQRVAAEHGVWPHVTVLIRDRTIPKTTSGKIARFRARAAYQEGTLEELHRFEGKAHPEVPLRDLLSDSDEDPPTQEEEDEEEGAKSDLADASSQQQQQPTPIGAAPRAGARPSGAALLAALQEEVARLTEGAVDGVDTKAPLLQLGMDSVTLTQFKGVLSNAYGTEIEEMELFDEETNLEYVRDRVDGAPMAARFAPQSSGSGAQNNGGQAAPRPAPPQRRKQSLFGCFRVCGC